MGFIVGILIRVLKLILTFAIFVAIILLIPNLPPYTKFTSIEIDPAQKLVGPLAPNNALNNPERLYEDKLLGPELFQILNGEVYTGLATGEIVKVSPGGHVTFVTKIGQPCTGLVQEHICGRPLGFVIDEANKLMYIADAYYGIWKVNLVTDKKQLLVSPTVPIEGRTPKFFNSVALDKQGNLFWTDSSSDFNLRDGVLSILVDPSGRLFHYNAAKNESEVLLDNLWFPNGLAVSPDNQFIVVAETSKFRLIKYYIDGPKKRSFEVFATGLPGLPDNVRALPDGSGVLVGLYEAFLDDSPILVKSMASAPLARKFLARLFRLIEIPFEYLNDQVPHYIFQEIVHFIGNFKSASKMSSGASGLVQLDWNGNIVAAYYNSDGKVPAISDAIVFNDKLYLGAPHVQNFIGAVPAPELLKKAFSLKQTPIKEQPKPIVPNQNKQNVKADKDIPKVVKTAEKKDQPKQAPQEAKKEPHIEKQPEKIKQNTKPKEAPKPDSKEAEIKTNQIPRAGDVKSNNVQKEAQKLKEPVAQVKPAPKESETKPKAVPKAQEKPKEEAKKVVSKPEVPEKPKERPKNPPKVQDKVKEQPKVKETTKQAEGKPKVQEIPKDAPKQASKETEPKIKTKEANIKPKVPKEQEKPQSINSDKKDRDGPKKNEKQSTENTKPKKQIPVEEIIPSDTTKPNNEKLKVIKKSGPQEIPNPHL